MPITQINPHSEDDAYNLVKDSQNCNDIGPKAMFVLRKIRENLSPGNV